MKFVVLLIFFFFLLERSVSLIKVKPNSFDKRNNKHNKSKIELNSKKHNLFSNNRNNENKRNNNNQNATSGKSKLIEKILNLEDLVKQENISPIDENVINDELFLISKGKVENLDNLTQEQLKQMDQSQLSQIENYLGAIPKINSIIENNPNTKINFYSPQNNKNNKINNGNHINNKKNSAFDIENSNINNFNYSGNEDVSEAGLKEDLHYEKQKKESLFSYLSDVNKKIEENKNKNNSNLNKKNIFNNGRDNNGKSLNNPKDRFRGSIIKNNVDKLRKRADKKNKQEMRKSIDEVLKGKSLASVKEPNVQNQINQIIKKINEKAKKQEIKLKKQTENYGRKFKNIKNYDDYEFEFSNDIDDEELDEVLTYGKEQAEKNRRNRRRNRRSHKNANNKINKNNKFQKINSKNSWRNKHNNKDQKNVEYSNSKSINYNHVNLKNKYLQGKLKSLSEFLLNNFNELLYNKILSIEYYVTKYELKENQASFLKSAVDKFYYPILSEKIIVNLLDDTKKIHFLGEDYLKKTLVKPLPQKIYKTLHDFLTVLCEALVTNRVEDLKDDILVNFAKLVY